MSQRPSLVHKTHGVIPLQYVPESITRERSANWQANDIPGTDDPLLTWVSGSGLTINVTAMFGGKAGWDVVTDLFAATTRNSYVNVSAPPVWSLYTGLRIVPVVVVSVSETQKNWDKNGEPDLCEVSISLRKYVPFKISAA
jgi:hypothetical protein